VRHGVSASLRRADALVAVSHSTATALRGLMSLPESHPIHVVPNGVDVARFQPLDADHGDVIRARTKLALTGRYLLYVARLEHPAKNHLRLLDAFAACPAARDRRLVFVGPDWGARETIEKHAAWLGLGQRLRILGEIDDAFLPALVAAADAATVVGLCEGFGLPVLEAFACGRPVVVANAGALPEVAGDLGVLCDGRSSASMSAAIARALTDESVKARAATEGPLRAKAHDWDASASRLVDLAFETVAARRRALLPATTSRRPEVAYAG
jgi:glycosyltransferase involved in cell wall biosynthesis